jgi:hypothetical protein
MVIPEDKLSSITSDILVDRRLIIFLPEKRCRFVAKDLPKKGNLGGRIILMDFGLDLTKKLMAMSSNTLFN